VWCGLRAQRREDSGRSSSPFQRLHLLERPRAYGLAMSETNLFTMAANRERIEMARHVEERRRRTPHPLGAGYRKLSDGSEKNRTVKAGERERHSLPQAKKYRNIAAIRREGGTGNVNHSQIQTTQDQREKGGGGIEIGTLVFPSGAFTSEDRRFRLCRPRRHVDIESIWGSASRVAGSTFSSFADSF